MIKCNELADGIISLCMDKCERENLHPSLGFVIIKKADDDEPRSETIIKKFLEPFVSINVANIYEPQWETIKEKQVAEIIQILQLQYIGHIRKFVNSQSVSGIMIDVGIHTEFSMTNLGNEIPFYMDVNGINPINIASLFNCKDPMYVQCADEAIVRLLLENHVELRNRHVVISSSIVNSYRPLAMLLLNEGAYVSLMTPQTINSHSQVRSSADIFICLDENFINFRSSSYDDLELDLNVLVTAILGEHLLKAYKNIGLEHQSENETQFGQKDKRCKNYVLPDVDPFSM